MSGSRTVMQKEAALPAEEVAVHGSSRAALEAPLFAAISGYFRRGMLQLHQTACMSEMRHESRGVDLHR